MGIELSHIRKVRVRKRLALYYPGAGIVVIKDRFEVAHGSRVIITY